MTSVWAYAVVSFYTQAETLETQRGRLLTAANEQGWTITRVFGEDASGVSSGKDGPRKLLQRLLDELKATPRSERPAYVLMTRQDRIGRGRLIDTAVILRDIYDLGVQLYTLEAGVMSLDDPMDEMVVMVRSLSSAQENKNRIDKAKQGHARRKARGLHDGHAPYGIVLGQGKPAPQEPQAAIVRALFDLRAQGYGLEVLRRYAKAHAPPKRQKNGRLRVLTWDKSSIRLMLRCQTYRGVVVPESVFDSVSRIERPGCYPVSNEGQWPLRGAVLCACGRRLSGRMDGKEPWRRRYYVCSSHNGRLRYYQAEAVERAFLEFLHSLRAHRDLHYSADDQARVSAEARHRALEIRRQIAATTTAQAKCWELAESGGISSDALRARLEQHDEHLKRLTAELARADEAMSRAQDLSRATMTASEILEAMPNYWPQCPPESQREIAVLLARALNGISITAQSTTRTVALEHGTHPQSADICLQMSPVWGRLSQYG